MLSNARQILISELVLAKDMDEEEVIDIIDNAFDNNPHIEEEE